MEITPSLLIPVILLPFLVRLRSLAGRLYWRALLHSACGFVCLWLLQAIAPYTGIYPPANPLAFLAASVLGLPGVLAITLAAGLF